MLPLRRPFTATRLGRGSIHRLTHRQLSSTRFQVGHLSSQCPLWQTSPSPHVPRVTDDAELQASHRFPVPAGGSGDGRSTHLQRSSICFQGTQGSSQRPEWQTSPGPQEPRPRPVHPPHSTPAEGSGPSVAVDEYWG